MLYSSMAEVSLRDYFLARRVTTEQSVRYIGLPHGFGVKMIHQNLTHLTSNYSEVSLTVRLGC